LLSVHGFTIEDVQRFVVYVVGDHDQVSAAWSVVEKWLPNSVPPATLLGVALLSYQE